MVKLITIPLTIDKLTFQLIPILMKRFTKLFVCV